MGMDSSEIVHLMDVSAMLYKYTYSVFTLPYELEREESEISFVRICLKAADCPAGYFADININYLLC